jgi:hypothetical protein
LARATLESGFRWVTLNAVHSTIEAMRGAG